MAKKPTTSFTPNMNVGQCGESAVITDNDGIAWRIDLQKGTATKVRFSSAEK